MAVTGTSPDAIKLIGWSTLPLVLSTVGVILRFAARRSTRNIGADDWCCLVALFLYYGLFITFVLWGPVGKVGWPQSEFSAEQMETFLKIFWCVQIFYGTVSPMVKMSFILLYRRLFVTPRFKLATLVVGTLVVAWGISVIVVVIFECVPVGSYWTLSRRSHCIDAQKFYWGNGISNFLIDCIILTMPLPVVWRLKMSTTRKISVTLVFGLGLFITVASILRITYLFYIQFDNITGTIAIPSIFTALEPGLGIFCACLPALPVLFRGWGDTLRSSWNGSSGQRWLSRSRTSSLVRIASSKMSSSTASEKNGSTSDEREKGANSRTVDEDSLPYFERTSADRVINVEQSFSVERHASPL